MKPQEILRMSEIAQYDTFAQSNINTRDVYVKQLESENKYLKQRVSELEQENERLKADVETLQDDIERMYAPPVTEPIESHVEKAAETYRQALEMQVSENQELRNRIRSTVKELAQYI